MSAAAGPVVGTIAGAKLAIVLAIAGVQGAIVLTAAVGLALVICVAGALRS